MKCLLYFKSLFYKSRVPRPPYMNLEWAVYTNPLNYSMNLLPRPIIIPPASYVKNTSGEEDFSFRLRMRSMSNT